MTTQTFQCPTCGAPLDYDGGTDYTIQCPFCKQTVIVPENLRPARGRMAVISEETLEQIHELAASGRRTQAAMLYRDRMGVSMEQAEQAVDQLVSRPEAPPPPIAPAEVDSVFEKIKTLSLAGNKIEAIKEYRAVFNVGLKEAKDAIDQMDAGGWMERVLPAPAAAPLNEQQAIQKILQLAQSGNKIEAIKLFRQTYDVGLMDAKLAVEAMLQAGQWDPSMTASMRPRPAETVTINASAPGARRAGCALIGVVVAIAVIGAVIALVMGAVGLFATTRTVQEAIITQVFSTAELIEGIPATPAPTLNYLPGLQFGAQGIGAGHFTDSRWVGVDAEGNIYTGEYIGGHVQAFNSSGQFLTDWLVDAEMPLRALAVDRDGKVYIAQKGKLYRYDGSTGELLGELSYPVDGYIDDVYVLTNGSLAVTSTGVNDEIAILDPDGSPRLKIPNAFSGNGGQHELIIHLAVDGLGNIYALGGFNYAVFKFNSEGQFISRFGSQGDGEGQFRAPEDIAVDGQGRVYVSDIYGVQVFAPDGRYLDTIAFDPGQVPFGLVFTADDDLLIAFREYMVRITPQIQ